MSRGLYLFLILATAALAACKGDYSGGTASSSSSAGGGGNNTSFSSSEQFFKARVQPRLDFCRTCHIPSGVGDVPDGKLFMLSSNKVDDLSNLRASWERLGKNTNAPSRILTMPSGTDARAHSGGTPWSKNSDAYKDMAVMLVCFDDPVGCLTQIVGGVVGQLLPLLGSARGGHTWFDFCEGKADSALLPPDPRSLVQPGVNQGKAVYFNAYWKDCHVDPERVNERPHPKTCGELRESTARGAVLMEGNGVFGQASIFAGQEPNGYAAVPAGAYNKLWQVWGLSERPDNFEELVAERYGFGPVPVRNPYPLPGEDPNQTNGGSGQLPRGSLQTRNADGSWSGNISNNCQSCHSINIEEVGLIYGGGGAQFDASVLVSDSVKLGLVDLAALNPVGVLLDRAGLGGKTRGTNNAQFSNITALLALAEGQPPDAGLIDVLTNGATGSGDTPAWWNVGRRPLKFVDGMFPGDAVRVDFALYYPLLDRRPVPSGLAQANAWVSEHVQDGDHWIMSLKSPAYPLPVDAALAEQGAILFHGKNLWDANLNNPVRKPAGGNGSCASCHGAYSPRYVNDPTYLDSPALEGIASYVVPIDLIGTDSVRMATYNEGTNQYVSRSFIGYPETAGTEQDCGVQNSDALRGDRPLGYAAPPLYGVWATAPYFHNGAVPNVWEVLQPADRKPIWRRVSKPARPDQQGKVVMGYDASLQRAFDQEKMGWKYEALECGAGTLPYLECDPADPQANPIVQQILSQVYSNVLLAWNLAALPLLSNAQIEQRKIYNTHMHSQDNGGHEFTAVLTDQERRALIEYLKTL